MWTELRDEEELMGDRRIDCNGTRFFFASLFFIEGEASGRLKDLCYVQGVDSSRI